MRRTTMAETQPMGTEKAQLRANEATVKAHEATADAAHEDLKKDRAERIKNNEAKMAYDAKQRPTPTPDEMLAANAGKNVLEKEPSGAVSQDMNDPPHMHLDPHLRKDEPRKRAASAEGHDASYNTRASVAKDQK
jgi:hypothetical protein